MTWHNKSFWWGLAANCALGVSWFAIGCSNVNGRSWLDDFQSISLIWLSTGVVGLLTALYFYLTMGTVWQASRALEIRFPPDETGQTSHGSAGRDEDIIQFPPHNQHPQEQQHGYPNQDDGGIIAFPPSTKPEGVYHKGTAGEWGGVGLEGRPTLVPASRVSGLEVEVPSRGLVSGSNGEGLVSGSNGENGIDETIENDEASPACESGTGSASSSSAACPVCATRRVECLCVSASPFAKSDLESGGMGGLAEVLGDSSPSPKAAVVEEEEPPPQLRVLQGTPGLAPVVPPPGGPCPPHPHLPAPQAANLRPPPRTGSSVASSMSTPLDGFLYTESSRLSFLGRRDSGPLALPVFWQMGPSDGHATVRDFEQQLQEHLRGGVGGRPRCPNPPGSLNPSQSRPSAPRPNSPFPMGESRLHVADGAPLGYRPSLLNWSQNSQMAQQAQQLGETPGASCDGLRVSYLSGSGAGRTANVSPERLILEREGTTQTFQQYSEAEVGPLEAERSLYLGAPAEDWVTVETLNPSSLHAVYRYNWRIRVRRLCRRVWVIGKAVLGGVLLGGAQWCLKMAYGDDREAMGPLTAVTATDVLFVMVLRMCFEGRKERRGREGRGGHSAEAEHRHGVFSSRLWRVPSRLLSRGRSQRRAAAHARHVRRFVLRLVAISLMVGGLAAMLSISGAHDRSDDEFRLALTWALAGTLCLALSVLCIRQSFIEGISGWTSFVVRMLTQGVMGVGLLIALVSVDGFNRVLGSRNLPWMEIGAPLAAGIGQSFAVFCVNKSIMAMTNQMAEAIADHPGRPTEDGRAGSAAYYEEVAQTLASIRYSGVVSAQSGLHCILVLLLAFLAFHVLPDWRISVAMGVVLVGAVLTAYCHAIASSQAIGIAQERRALSQGGSSGRGSEASDRAGEADSQYERERERERVPNTLRDAERSAPLLSDAPDLMEDELKGEGGRESPPRARPLCRSVTGPGPRG
uniref:Uncharacterized protein n=1 Tax=Chromera velia CCMP2878 TaxID=1169474 RepID=A0A0G4HWV7_9ALVE|eukprot:Cvel_9141.t1-p1 / transcript=Cvel_9141.t1 / gene=Cvel_9141 / organism=Chromera_velia_CCMP2878 / gene_product=hypothetical protein / transcript_product=hypothetical protein / location=Cvel_scaffold520:17850-24344(+) / protein_length=970 / sequence_SO=supercontig / SO=protein_coding / is_pseudo=false